MGKSQKMQWFHNAYFLKILVVFLCAHWYEIDLQKTLLYNIKLLDGKGLFGNNGKDRTDVTNKRDLKQRIVDPH